MACNCKHASAEIDEELRTIAEFKKLFVKRMTVDSKTKDHRRKDFNQAIFFWDEYAKEYSQVFCGTTMEMVLCCFDDAVKDYRRTFCDVKNCKQ